MKKRKVFGWTAFFIFSIGFAGYFIMLKNGTLRHLESMYYPSVPGRIEMNLESEWMSVTFSELIYSSTYEPVGSVVTETFSYDSPFVKRELICTGNSTAKDDVEIRVVDSDGNEVVAPCKMRASSSISLDSLESGVEYSLQCRKGNGEYFFMVL